MMLKVTVLKRRDARQLPTMAIKADWHHQEILKWNI
jgi:hypothetical protein